MSKRNLADRSFSLLLPSAILFSVLILSQTISSKTIQQAGSLHVSFVSPTPPNNTVTPNTTVVFNASIELENYPLANMTWNWNGSNISFYDDTLLLHLNLDNNSQVGDGTSLAVDSSRYENNFTITNSVWTLSGKYGGAIGFDGLGDYISRTSLGVSSLTSGYTIMAWFNCGQITGTDTLVNTAREGESYVSLMNASNITWIRAYHQIANDTYVTLDNTVPFSCGVWNHIAFTWDGSEMLTYMNGHFNNSRVNVTQLVERDNNTYFGVRLNLMAGYEGMLDEIRIYNRSLSAAEIRQHYLGNLKKYNSTYWEFYTNQTNLSVGGYAYQAYVADTAAAASTTGLQILNISNIVFMPPTPADSTATTNASVKINASILFSSSQLANLTWHWNGSNYSFYDDSLVLHLNLDNNPAIGENSTYVVDSSRHGNNGSFRGQTFWNSSGKFGYGVDLDGYIDYLQIPDSEILRLGDDGFALEAWIYMKGPSPTSSMNLLGAEDIITKWNSGPTLTPYYGYELFCLYNSGQPICNIHVCNGDTSVNESGATPVGVVSLNRWHHIVGNLNQTEISIWVDGVRQSSLPKTLVYSPSTAPVGVGANAGIGSDGDRFFNGSIDEVRIYNRSLSASEIRQHYLSNLKKYNSTYWTFYSNQTNLVTGNHTYQAFVSDTAGQSSSTGQRALVVSNSPQAVFVSPTPANNTLTTNTSVQVNVSIQQVGYPLSDIIWNWNGSNTSFYDDSLVLHLNLDNNSAIGENAAYAVDASKYGNNGTLLNLSAGTRPVLSPGRYGSGLNFTGGGGYGYVNIPLDSELKVQDNFTLVVWTKINYSVLSGPGHYLIAAANLGFLENGIGYGLVYFENFLEAPTNNVTFGLLCNGITYWSTYTILSGSEWHHVVANHDSSGRIEFYINGVFINNATGSSSCGITDQTNLILGQSSPPWTSNAGFQGLMDEIRIYNRTLSAAEIWQQYTSNLRQVDSLNWTFYSNQTNLTVGNYTYEAFVSDTVGQRSSTGQRRLSIVGVTVPPSIVITPSSPKTASLLNCTASGSVDSEGSTITYYYLFNKTGSLLRDRSAASTYDCNSTGCGKGDTIYCWAYATSGGYNSTVNYNTTVIQNTLPVVGSANIAPATAYTNGNLSCENGTVSDADGDLVTLNYVWYNDTGVIASGLNSLSGSTYFNHFDNLTCGIIPYDDEDIGAQVNSTSIMVNNSRPDVILALTPTAAKVNTNLTCTATASDDDNDNVSIYYGWQINGTNIAYTPRTLNCTRSIGCGRGANVSCSAIPYDSFDNGTIRMSNNITLSNTLPTISNVSINPTPAYDYNSLSCDNGTISDADADTISLYHSWYKNGTLQTGLTTKTIGSGNLTNFDIWVCMITASDGTSNTSRNSSEVQIGAANTAPTLTEATSDSLHPGVKNVTQNVTFTANWTDTEGDTVIMYVCNSTAITIAGCAELEYCSSNYSTTNPKTCRYIIQETDNSTTTAYLKVCDSIICSNTREAVFEANHVPNLTSPPIITPTTAYITAELACGNGTFYDLDGDTNGTPIYRWYVNGSQISNTNSRLQAGMCGKADTIVCEQTPVDEHGLPGNAQNSTSLTILNSPPVLDYTIDRNVTVLVPFSLDVNATDADNDTLTYSTNATFFIINPATGLINFTLTSNSSNGLHQVNVTVSDGVETDSQVFRMSVRWISDNTAPGVTNIIANDAYVGDTVDVYADVTDDVAVSNVMANITFPISNDSQTINLTLAYGNSYWGTFYNTTSFGDYNITIIAYDYHENVNDSEVESFFISFRGGGPTTLPTTVATTVETTVETTILPRETTVESTTTVQPTTSTSTVSTSTVTTTTTLLLSDTCYHICLGLYNTSESRCYSKRSCSIEDPAGTWVHQLEGDWDCEEANPDNPYCCCPEEIISTTSTTTTIPSSCYEVCRADYNSIDSRCYSRRDCAIPDSDWQWRHSAKADWDCKEANPENPYCCCPVSGNYTRVQSDESTVGCSNGVKDVGETEADCGGPCGPCQAILEVRVNLPEYVYPNETFTVSAEIRAKADADNLIITLNSPGIFQPISKPSIELNPLKLDERKNLVWDMTSSHDPLEGTYVLSVDANYTNSTQILSESFRIKVVYPLIISLPGVGELKLKPPEILQEQAFRMINNMVRYLYRGTMLWLSLLIILFGLGYLYYRGRRGGGRGYSLRNT
ncbi:MAG: LamG-like jellyroll fold domain-containing protein [Candidatus Altiarchaeota archaeon]